MSSAYAHTQIHIQRQTHIYADIHRHIYKHSYTLTYRDTHTGKQDLEGTKTPSDAQMMELILTAILFLKQELLCCKQDIFLLKSASPTYLIIQFSCFHFKQDHSVILYFFCWNLRADKVSERKLVLGILIHSGSTDIVT